LPLSHKAIELDPKSANAYYNLGIALFGQKKLPEAVAAYHKAVEFDPKDRRCPLRPRPRPEGSRKLDEAVAAYHKAVEFDPKDADAHYALGLALHDQKKLDEAVTCYRKAIEIDPKSARAYSGLGNALNALLDQKKLPEAIAPSSRPSKSIRTTPTPTTASQPLRERKNCPRPCRSLPQGHRNRSEIRLCHKNLGVALHEQKKLPEAVAALHKAIELEPKYA